LVDYCAVADVKVILRLESAVTTEDAELTDCIHDASVKVTNILKAAGLEVPSLVPDSVGIGAKNFAAWLYRRRRDPEGAQVFYYDAQEALKDYVNAEKPSDVPYVGMA
jgi:hypothetical protein